MSTPFKRILYGGDYNPNQWPKDIWQEDMRIFKDAHINTATINVFSWAKIQPSEHEYNFDELDEIVDMLSKENYDIVFATSTAALPGWMVRKYPEVMFTDYEGRQHKFGGRHNACPNSFVFKHYARELAYKLAERYADNPHVTCWHVSNEYGNECFCENCQKAFRVWLKDKYKTIDALNRAWNMEFWGHTVYDWDDVVPPNALSDGIGSEKTAFAGISIDYRRFYSDSQLACFKMERDAIRSVKPDAFVTTNLMGTFKGLDYFKWAKEMDVVSWDNYPSYDTPWSSIAMTHDLMRGLKDEPFMLMEQTPSQQNWQKYNSLKRPGQMRAQSYQTLAHGADTIQFFQLRRSVGGCEKFHGAVIAHVGNENTRVFREAAALGAELKALGDETLGARARKETAILFDWDNWWAIEYSAGPSVLLKYRDEIQNYYTALYEQNMATDIIGVEDDFSDYRVIIAPVLYMVKPGVDEKIKAFVQAGGIFVTTFFSGYVDEHDLVVTGGYPGKLRDLLGIWVEESDALPEGETNHFTWKGARHEAVLLCDLLHPEGAEVLATYEEDFYAGMPVLTKKRYGAGAAYYVAVRSDALFYEALIREICEKAGITPVAQTPGGVEAVLRVGRDEKKEFLFLLNHEKIEQSVPVEQDATDLVTGMEWKKGSKLTLPAYGVAILKRSV